MSGIVGTFLFPHPPIMIEEIGGEETKKVMNTIKWAEEAAERIKALAPDTIVIISPHGALFRDAMSILADEEIKGDMARFGAKDLKLTYQNDIELVDEIIKVADRLKVYCVPITEDVKKTYQLDKGLDHGAFVPLYYINKKYKECKIVHINYSLLPREDHYKLGIAIKEACKALNRKVVIIASGDLSHRLTKDAPAGYHKSGEVFDQALIKALKKGDVSNIFDFTKGLCEEAGECGYTSLLVLLGCLDGCDLKGDILSYEGPFGVGYCVAQILFEHCKGESNILSDYLHSKRSSIDEKRKQEDSYVRLARQSLEYYVKNNKRIKAPIQLPEELINKQAGVFVSIKKDGELRGCIGTISAVRENIAEEIIENAVSAGTGDPRFDQVEQEELDDLVYSVDVLGEPEDIESTKELDVLRFGIIVRSGRKSGLLLPNLEGVDTIEEQLRIVLMKAGIKNNEKYSMQRFEVVRHH